VGLCALVALAGCGSSKPAPDREPDAQPEARGLSHFDRAPAINEFARKVSERNASGWPPTVKHAGDGSGRVLARLLRPVNSGKRECDLAAFQAELLQALTDQGVLAIELAPDAAAPAGGTSATPKTTGRRAAPQTEPPPGPAPTHAPETGRGTAPVTEPEGEYAVEGGGGEGEGEGEGRGGALRIVSRIEDEPGGGVAISIQLVGDRPIITTRAAFH